MRTVRAFVQRVPLGPVVIALLMVGVLALVNLYGSQGGTERAAPSEPVGIPPQLPIEELPVPVSPAPPGASAAPAVPTTPAPESVPPSPQADPSRSVVPTVSPPASTGGATAPQAQLPAQATPVVPPTTSPSGAAAAPAGQGGAGTPSGGDDAPTGGTYSSSSLKVVGAVLTSNRETSASVRCNGRDEIMITATVLVDGGEGDVVYQWYFDDVRSWPPDQLHFTGDGQRQQSLTIPWPVGIRFSGTRVKATVQLRILQPVVNAQTHKINIDVLCI